MQELFDYKEKFLYYYKSNIKDIRKNISIYNVYFKIENYYEDDNDFIEFVENDNDYNRDFGFKYIESGIKILLPLKEFWNDIKDYISKDITKLEIPFYLIEEDLKYLVNFPNLDTLIINDYYVLNKEYLDLILELTTIKKIYTNANPFVEKIESKKNNYFKTCFPYNIFMYNDLVILEKDKNKKVSSFCKFYELIINCSILDKNKLEKLYVMTGYNDNKIIRINSLNTGEYLIKFKEKNQIEYLDIKSNNFYDGYNFYNYLINKGYSIDNIYLDFQNINYYYDDLSIYKDISKNTNLSFRYLNNNIANYEEFYGLIESLRWYREIIIENNLSPIEKIMYAFDIVKTFLYKDSLENKRDSRTPHRIIETGNIVCVGYSELLNLILKKIDKNILISSYSVVCYDKDKKFLGRHERNIFKVDDNKYNIHGIYSLDATWDSVKDNINNIVGDDYTALDLYRYFLIPVLEYENTFRYDTMPNLFEIYLETTYSKKEGFYNSLLKKCKDKEKEENIIFLKEQIEKEYYELLKEKLSEVEIRKYMDVERPSLEVFNNILYNVRISEGYSSYDAFREIEKVNRINKKLIKHMNNNSEKLNFFK